MSTKKEILLTEKDHTLWITLNRPEASNAYTPQMMEDLVNALYTAEENSKINTIVITGAGKHFCAGGDLKQMSSKIGMFAGESNELRLRYKQGIQKIPVCLESISKPVIAMVNGAAIGAGLDLACMCDIRVSTENAKYGETFTKLGLVPGDGGSFFLQRIIGFAKAMELTLTARVIDSSEALSIGLVNYVVGANELEQKTQEIINQIHSCSPVATQMAKKSIQHAYQGSLSTSLELLASFQGIAQRTPEHFQAVEKFLKK